MVKNCQNFGLKFKGKKKKNIKKIKKKVKIYQNLGFSDQNVSKLWVYKIKNCHNCGFKAKMCKNFGVLRSNLFSFLGK